MRAKEQFWKKSHTYSKLHSLLSPKLRICDKSGKSKVKINPCFINLKWIYKPLIVSEERNDINCISTKQ